MSKQSLLKMGIGHKFRDDNCIMYPRAQFDTPANKELREKLRTAYCNEVNAISETAVSRDMTTRGVYDVTVFKMPDDKRIEVITDS